MLCTDALVPHGGRYTRHVSPRHQSGQQMEQLARPAYPIAADAVEYWTHKLSLGLPEDTDLLSTDWFQRHARSGAGRALQDWCSGSQLDASDVYWSFVSDMVQRYKLGSGVQRPGSVPCWAKLSRDRCGWSTSHIIPSVSPFQVRCETVHAKLGCKSTQ